MPTKIKLILTFLVVLITSIIFYIHFIEYEYITSSIILVISIIMVFGLGILPEATGKTKEIPQNQAVFFMDPHPPREKSGGGLRPPAPVWYVFSRGE